MGITCLSHAHMLSSLGTLLCCCSSLSCSFLLEHFHRFCLSLCCSLLLGHFHRLLAYLVLSPVRALPRASLTSLVLTAIIGGTVINVGGSCDSGIQWLLA